MNIINLHVILPLLSLIFIDTGCISLYNLVKGDRGIIEFNGASYAIEENALEFFLF